MVYRNYHCEKNNSCDDDSCTTLSAYVRIEGKWTKIGYYGSLCKQFSHLDLQQEEKDRQLKLRLLQFKSDIQQIKNRNYSPDS
ncbi:hypothetical protein [Nitrosarchaeum sp.]|uniref:hypothetical protein n=1 Tax=Nitrosarchaeum sp. TaxID=2026886 RepID=UPI00247B5895|nr:hypothetical protein [Nitrosarchaeum sp.]MCV0412195.1 hypothetical protein [Nitrosarchaeum sp.]